MSCTGQTESDAARFVRQARAASEGVCAAARQVVLHKNDMRSDFLWHKCGLRLIGEEQAIWRATVQAEEQWRTVCKYSRFHH
jgi:hypothetical protein